MKEYWRKAEELIASIKFQYDLEKKGCRCLELDEAIEDMKLELLKATKETEDA